ncbi:hypothetical protein Kpol_461p11 [Vanderwaltozyma polyspora DSM 70294]|uniref:DNA mismatch repair proteins mutS family domain-containing protein n=1 Tax=Vanderwaltozyma polyspora (strain ATCC 22028 / DSM 70294 / BCRC 21397 / CBS 2163 / NBRC 10782 / NRRL Y-8283 / UCD 57-17) TaxID=436907 RepID=A7TR47_VANPO|nr:uncharacterized protein Kpol_461p11 [Vanderwaltozyma polyspora DSM 70294]EDO15257.1 hypothetical protein Kpol_461p11 [Vanderwaltozyma polyspora DSM 70294]
MTVEVEEPTGNLNESEAYNRDEVILCLDINKDRLGCSVWEESNHFMRCLPQDYVLNSQTTYNLPSVTFERHGMGSNDLKYTEEIKMVTETLLLKYSPTFCVISSRVDDSCYEYIKSKCEILNCTLDLQSTEKYKLNNEFENLTFVDSESYVLYNNVLDCSSSTSMVTVNTICWILSHLIEQSRSERYNDDCLPQDTVMRGHRVADVTTLVLSLSSINVTDRMFVDSDTLYSLNILPRLMKYGNDNTLGNGCFSLFEILNQTCSQPAKQLLRSWLVTPLSDKDQIEARFNIVDTFISKVNAITFENLCFHITKCPDVSNVFNKFISNGPSYIAWRRINDFLLNGIEIHHCLTLLNHETRTQDIIETTKKTISTSDLKNLVREINSVIDFELSQESKNLVIREGIDDKLDECRQVYRQLEDILNSLANEVEVSIFEVISQGEFNPDLSKDNLINALYIPQLGYLITLDNSFEGYIDCSELFGWKEVFRTPTNIYFKDERSKRLDEEFGDIYGNISDLEIDILLKLQERVFENATLIQNFNKLIIELDVLSSFARVSIEKSYIRPTIIKDRSIIDIKGGRHPIYETLVETYIPNDISLDGGELNNLVSTNNLGNDWITGKKERIAIITGANASGKSVFLTQVALIVYLSHIGCFVPAESAVIGITDKILSKIQMKESVSNQHSSFELDSRQVAKCIVLATERSLILLDEFGKGTDINDGPALFGACLKNLAQQKHCPRVLACSHFHELFKDHIISPRSHGIKFYSTEILLNRSNNKLTPNVENFQENEGITFLYKLKEGIANQSFGIYCASVAGIDNDIVKRAYKIKEMMDNGYNLVDYCGEITKKELQQFQKNQNIVKKFISWDLDIESTASKELLKSKLTNMLHESSDDLFQM